ncbi:hypothetical protein AAG906_028651 [Vitis piasezkii]
MKVFTTHHWMVRIYKLKPPKNRIRVKTKKSKSKASSTTSSKKVEKKEESLAMKGTFRRCCLQSVTCNPHI